MIPFRLLGPRGGYMHWLVLAASIFACLIVVAGVYWLYRPKPVEAEIQVRDLQTYLPRRGVQVKLQRIYMDGSVVTLADDVDQPAASNQAGLVFIKAQTGYYLAKVSDGPYDTVTVIIYLTSGHVGLLDPTLLSSAASGELVRRCRVPTPGWPPVSQPPCSREQYPGYGLLLETK